MKFLKQLTPKVSSSTYLVAVACVVFCSFYFQGKLCRLKTSFSPIAVEGSSRQSITSCEPQVKECVQEKKSSALSAPLYAPSPEELKKFPGARVVEALEIDEAEQGKKRRMRVLETHFKYPYIRTEEIVDSASGALLHRSEMVATHFLVRLPQEEDPEHFLNQLGPNAIALERVTLKEPLYQVKLTSSSLIGFTQVSEEIKRKYLSRLYQEPDFLVHASMIPNNPLYSQQWYLWKNCSHINGVGDTRIFSSGIDACGAWDQRTSAASVIVAVIDTGIRYTHEDLAANIWHEEDPLYGTLYGWNFSVPFQDLKETDPMDGFGHGTACAGIIGATGNSNLGITGIAWNVKLMALKFLDDQGNGDVSDAIQAIDFACDHGAQILNCSWGYVTQDARFNNLISGDHLSALEMALSRARDRGVIVVAAAGNEGKNNDENPEYPANYSLDNIISVGATTEDNRYASFSNYGPKSVHLAAPGEEIFSTWARNDHDYITPQTREAILGGTPSDLAQQPKGTSLSVPQVVGALALLKSQFPTWSHQQLRERLMSTCDKNEALEGKVIAGKLNIARALQDPIE